VYEDREPMSRGDRVFILTEIRNRRSWETGIGIRGDWGLMFRGNKNQCPGETGRNRYLSRPGSDSIAVCNRYLGDNGADICVARESVFRGNRVILYMLDKNMIHTA
jgi:hypothetical protein